MSQPDDRGIEISNVPSEARSAEGGVGAVASIPPNLKSKSGACSHHIWAYVPPTFGLNPIPLPLRASFLSCFLSMALSAPFLPLFCTPLPYALSPFPSTFPSSSHSRSFLFPFPRGPIPSQRVQPAKFCKLPSRSGQSPADKWFVNCILRSKQLFL